MSFRISSMTSRSAFARSAARIGLIAALSVLSVMGLSACAGSGAGADSSNNQEKSSTGTDGTNQNAQQSQTESTGSRSLVAVFSWSGNTLQVAEHIVERTSADFFRIEPVVPYTDNYDELIDIAKAEQDQGSLPEISGTVENFDGYDRVYLGYPVWWYDAPQIVKTFVGQYDFSGKEIVPFCTSGGSSLSTTLSELQALAPDATWLDGITIAGSSVDAEMGEVDTWLEGLGAL